MIQTERSNGKGYRLVRSKEQANGLGCSSVVEVLPNMYRSWLLSLALRKEKRKKRQEFHIVMF
jgi:hypothetical protein